MMNIETKKSTKKILGGFLIILGLVLMQIAVYKAAYAKGLHDGKGDENGKYCVTVKDQSPEETVEEETAAPQQDNLNDNMSWLNSTERAEKLKEYEKNHYNDETPNMADETYDGKVESVRPTDAGSDKNAEEATKKEQQGWNLEAGKVSETEEAEKSEHDDFKPEELHEEKAEEPATPEVEDSFNGSDLEVLPQEKNVQEQEIEQKVEKTEVVALDGYETTVGSTIQFQVNGSQDLVIEGLDSSEYSFAGGILSVNVKDAGCLTFTVNGVAVSIIVNGF